MSPRAKRASKQRALVWTARAARDLERIGDFIAQDKPVAAAAWVRELVRLAASAAVAPFAGRQVPEAGREEIRELVKQGYRIVHRVSEGSIHILTVFESHRRFPPVGKPRR